MPTALPRYYFHALLLGGLFIMGWEISALDVPLAALSFNAATQTFEWRDHWLLTTVLHSAIKNVLVCAVLYVLLATVLPASLRSKLPVFGARARSVNVVFLLMILAPAMLVSALKSQSLPFCPWDEIGLGGSAPQYQWWQPLFQDMSGRLGRCWPAGHASAGFGLFAVYFFGRFYAPQQAKLCLFFALSIGFVMGFAQQIRGAHFLSHTLWTAWLAWAVCGVLAPLLMRVVVSETTVNAQ
jgi:membrane-associated PAP2 superfamily phosphatase